MKRSILRFWSLVANLALGGWIVWETTRPPTPLPHLASLPAPSSSPEIPSLPAETNALTIITAPPAPAPFHWSQVESTNYLTYIEHLRAIHCPEPVIRSLITGELGDLYIQQRQQLLAPWQGLVWDEAARALRSPEKWLKQMEPTAKEVQKNDEQLQGEMKKLLKTLLGDSPPPPAPHSPNPPRVPDALAGYLSDEKQKQVQEIEKKYDTLANDFRQNNRGKREMDLRAPLEELTRQRRQEIQTLLTTGEYDEYRLRTSSASGLRYQVYGFEASPEEWRELVRKKMEFDEAHPAPQGNSPEAKAQREEWQKTQAQLDDQYKSVLGTDRFAAYQRAQQGDYQDILRVVERCELPTAAAGQVFDLKRTAETSAQQLRQTTDLSPEQRAVALEAMRRETERAVRQTLGDRGFQTYLRYRGDWLSRMTQP